MIQNWKEIEFQSIKVKYEKLNDSDKEKSPNLEGKGIMKLLLNFK